MGTFQTPLLFYLYELKSRKSKTSYETLRPTNCRPGQFHLLSTTTRQISPDANQSLPLSLQVNLNLNIKVFYSFFNMWKLNDSTDYIAIVLFRGFSSILTQTRVVFLHEFNYGTSNLSLSSSGNRTIKDPSTESIIQLLKYVNKKPCFIVNI